MRKVGCKNWKIGSGEVFSNSLMREILKKKLKDLFLAPECLIGLI